MNSQIFCAPPACWAPGLITKDDWEAWTFNNKQILKSRERPPISFTPPLFRRRLSQLSCMIIQVVHDALTSNNIANIKQSFISFRGEIGRQFSVNKTLIQEQTVMPAAFSLSVFNTPVALASIANQLKNGYSAIFSKENHFFDAFVTAIAPVLCGDEENILLIYGDELIPEEYDSVNESENIPLAFACVVSGKKNEICTIPCNVESVQNKTPAIFLKSLLKSVYGENRHD